MLRRFVFGHRSLVANIVRFTSSTTNTDNNGNSTDGPSAASAHTHKVQVAIIGSGAGGCYLADYLVKRHPAIHIDMYERMPVPYGLVRYGVAPDHPEVKNVEARFAQVLESKHVTWLGNINIGKDITIPQLREAYSIIVLATGAENDTILDIPGKELGDIHPARHFVDYYNTMPSPKGNPFMCPFPLPNIRDALIIGNGNVALDIARVLATNYKHWCPTDMNMRAVKQLMENRIRRISVVARRGPEHAAFTTAELRELVTLAPGSVTVQLEAFDLNKAMERSDQSRKRKRMLELMKKYSTDSFEGIVSSEKEKSSNDRGRCNINFLFNMKPLRYVPSAEDKNRVGGVMFERTNEETGDKKVVVIPAKVVFTSIGYRGESIPDVPFDEATGRIPTMGGGRVLAHVPTDSSSTSEVIPGLYTCGWAKRGAKGVILHAMMDAQETATMILNDIENKLVPDPTKRRGKYSLLNLMIAKNLMPVGWKGAQRIFASEKEKGVDLGKRLEKVDNIRAMLDLAQGGKVGKSADLRFRGVEEPRPAATAFLGQFLDDETELSDFMTTYKDQFPLAAMHAVMENRQKLPQMESVTEECKKRMTQEQNEHSKSNDNSGSVRDSLYDGSL